MPNLLDFKILPVELDDALDMGKMRAKSYASLAHIYLDTSHHSRHCSSSIPYGISSFRRNVFRERRWPTAWLVASYVITMKIKSMCIISKRLCLVAS